MWQGVTVTYLPNFASETKERASEVMEETEHELVMYRADEPHCNPISL